MKKKKTKKKKVSCRGGFNKGLWNREAGLRTALCLKPKDSLTPMPLIQSRSSWTLYVCSCSTLQPCSEKPFKCSLYSGCSSAVLKLVELLKTSSCVLNF